ncbi:hypothetical protein [Microbulbifer epialgicus]|uniref:Uncharacterized protein n=1 Tax=Microbulbifer epialgicus TaxID=393907 RepID=A0ABV4P695_9GAMM
MLSPPKVVPKVKCTIAVIDDQNNVQTDGVGDLIFSAYVTTNTRQTDEGSR